MITYIEELTDQEREAIREAIQLLYRQTYLLERRYDRRTEKYQYTKEYRTCSAHLEFLKDYFAVAGISLEENVHDGIIYIQGETLWGEKLPRLATVYLLILKLIYDEQMAQAASSTRIVATAGEINQKAGAFRVIKSIPSPTEMRRTIALLKKYQIVEPLDILEELNENTRMIIYPTVNLVLSGDHIRELLESFSEEENSGEETAIQNTIEDLSE